MPAKHAFQVITGRIAAISRLKSSRMGNPRFMLTIDTADGSQVKLSTSPDAGLAYGIENPEYRNELHDYTLNGWGHVVNAQPTKGN